MEDENVRTILGNVRSMSVQGHCPVDYIDGVLAGMPPRTMQPDMNAMAYGHQNAMPICGSITSTSSGTSPLFGGEMNMNAIKAKF